MYSTRIFNFKKSDVPKKYKINPIAIRRDMSPILFTITAFKLALRAKVLVYQKPINKYENIPTPSQPMNINT
jgi:hypothetical protein